MSHQAVLQLVHEPGDNIQTSTLKVHPDSQGYLVSRHAHIRQRIIVGEFMPAVLAPPPLYSPIMPEADNVMGTT